jgi:hypothetical protein
MAIREEGCYAGADLSPPATTGDPRMKPTTPLREPWARSWLSIGILALVGGAWVGPAAEPPAHRDAKAVARLIDDLANRKPPPPLLKDPSGGNKEIPLFPEDYDWDEQNRVRRALAELNDETTVEAWEELVKRIGDKRYCLTVKDETSGIYTNGHWTVGSFCQFLARKKLICVYQQHLKEGPGVHRPWGLDIGLDGPNALAEWRKKRMDRSFAELQVEVCERALRALPRREGIPQSQKDWARRSIEGELEQLKRTKRPVLRRTSLGPNGFYSAKNARECREELGIKRAKDR